MRMPVDRANPFRLTRCELETSLAHAYEFVTTRRSKREVVRLLNILRLQTRAPCYEWSWEQFHWYYVTFDALFVALADAGRIEVSRHKTKGYVTTNHRDKLSHVLTQIGVPADDAATELLLNRVAELRNDLVHEATWSKTMPGTEEDPSVVKLLRELNERLVFRLVGIERSAGELPLGLPGAGRVNAGFPGSPVEGVVLTDSDGSEEWTAPEPDLVLRLSRSLPKSERGQ